MNFLNRVRRRVVQAIPDAETPEKVSPWPVTDETSLSSLHQAIAKFKSTAFCKWMGMGRGGKKLVQQAVDKWVSAELKALVNFDDCSSDEP